MTAPRLRLVDAVDPIDVADPDASWESRAACNGADADLFFPRQGGDTATPKAICAACPVRVECLDYAIEQREVYGIWGGKSERERQKIRRGDLHPAKLQAIHDLLAEHQQVTSATLSARIEVTPERAAAILRRLETAGVLHRSHRLDGRWVYQSSGGEGDRSTA